MWHVMDKLAIQKTSALQCTPCIPEQFADHQENVILHMKTRVTML